MTPSLNKANSRMLDLSPISTKETGLQQLENGERLPLTISSHWANWQVFGSMFGLYCALTFFEGQVVR